jgi:hypothetical protein
MASPRRVCYPPAPRGRSSEVERQLPKLNVGGSIPPGRSNHFNELRRIRASHPAEVLQTDFLRDGRFATNPLIFLKERKPPELLVQCRKTVANSGA